MRRLDSGCSNDFTPNEVSPVGENYPTNTSRRHLNGVELELRQVWVQTPRAYTPDYSFDRAPVFDRLERSQWSVQGPENAVTTFAPGRTQYMPQFGYGFSDLSLSGQSPQISLPYYPTQRRLMSTGIIPRATEHDHTARSALLEEFRYNIKSNRRYELRVCKQVQTLPNSSTDYSRISTITLSNLLATSTAQGLFR